MGCFGRALIGLVVLGVIGGVSAGPIKKEIERRNRPTFKTEKVSRGTVTSFVNATGQLKPVETIKIGSFVSGPIRDMPPEIDFNAWVEKDAIMARVDPRLIEAQANSARASLAIREAEVVRTKAQLQLAINNEQRAIKLRAKEEGFVSQAEMDQLIFSRQQLEAAVTVAEASVKQAEAQKDIAEVNLEYTDITAPKAGIIIDRKIEPGQTLAAQFQTPELFEIGIDMDKRMHIYASVDESEIGEIQKAKEGDQPVTFTVFAYPDETFNGKIMQIRKNATELQNVVTYPVIVEAPNDGMKLFPNMTAEISFKIEERQDVLRVPQVALRFLPDRKYVREEDHKILDGSAWKRGEENEDDEEVEQSAGARAEAKKARERRHVWVKDGEKLKAVEVVLGLADEDEGKTQEILEGELNEGDEVVVSLEKKKGSWFGG